MEQEPSRKPDMSLEAAQAFMDVLKEMAKADAQPSRGGCIIA